MILECPKRGAAALSQLLESRTGVEEWKVRFIDFIPLFSRPALRWTLDHTGRIVWNTGSARTFELIAAVILAGPFAILSCLGYIFAGTSGGAFALIVSGLCAVVGLVMVTLGIFGLGCRQSLVFGSANAGVAPQAYLQLTVPGRPSRQIPVKLVFVRGSQVWVLGSSASFTAVYLVAVTVDRCFICAQWLDSSRRTVHAEQLRFLDSAPEEIRNALSTVLHTSGSLIIFSAIPLAPICWARDVVRWAVWPD